MRVLSMDVPLTHHAVGDDLDHGIHVVGAASVKPLHHDGKHACEIEFHHVCPLPLRNVKAFKNGVEDMLKHVAVHLVHIQRVELLDGNPEQTLIVLDKRQIRREIFCGYEKKLAPFATIKFQRYAFLVDLVEGCRAHGSGGSGAL